LHEYLKQATTGQLTSRMDSAELAQLRANLAQSQKSTQSTIVAAAVLLGGAILTGLETGPWKVWGLSSIGLVFLLTGAWLLFRQRK
jgi:hypothetical protein